MEVKSPEEQAAEYAKENSDVYGTEQVTLNEAWLAGHAAGAAHERARAEGLVEALEALLADGWSMDIIDGTTFIQNALAQFRSDGGKNEK